MTQADPDKHATCRRGSTTQTGIHPTTPPPPWRATRRLAVFCLLSSVFWVSPAAASPQPWRSLTPTQQEALAPLSQQWNGLPEAQQQSMLSVAKHYPELNAEEKQRFLSRLGAWSKLTPEQRQAARDKYRAFSQVPEDKREQVRQMVREEQAR
jgi:hypothetical protein